MVTEEDEERAKHHKRHEKKHEKRAEKEREMAKENLEARGRCSRWTSYRSKVL